MSAEDAVFLNSPLDVLGKFVELFQFRFSSGELLWTWSADENASEIFVHSELDLPKDHADASPAIIVTRGSFAYPRSVIGDDDQNNKDRITKGGKNYWSEGQGDLRIECVGQTLAESVTIADIVRTTVHMTREAICAAFSLRNISAIVVGRTVPYERSDEKWLTAVDFRVEFEERWFTVPVAPELRKIGFQPEGTILDINAGALTPAPDPGGGGNIIVSTGGGKVRVSSNDTLAEFLEDKLSAGANVAITVIDEGGEETLRISALGGARRDYVLNVSNPVPAQGTQYLYHGSVNLASAPIVMNVAATIVSAALRVNDADPTQDFDVQILVDGIVADTLSLAATNDVATGAFAIAVSSGEEISVRLVRTLGAAESAFNQVTLTLELQEI